MGKMKMTKKKQKDNLFAKAHSITKKIKQEEEKKKLEKLNKKAIEIKERVQSLREQKINDMSERIKKAAENGDSSIHISALESDTVEMRLLSIVREWARKEGFKLDSSYNNIYEPPHGSDDLLSDTRSFLTISWE